MNLGFQVEWALHCVTVLAGMPEGVLIPAKVLAEFHDVPKEYLSKSLQLLSNEGIVETSLGPKGGYRLARPANQISFLDVVEAVEGRKKTFNCQEIRRNNPCIPKSSKSFSKTCEIAAVMHEADEAWRQSLRKKKISDVVHELGRKLDPETLEKISNWFQDQLIKK
jgi:Rrf2 family protein